METAVSGGALLQLMMDMDGPAPQDAEAENRKNQQRDQAFHYCRANIIFLTKCK